MPKTARQVLGVQNTRRHQSGGNAAKMWAVDLNDAYASECGKCGKLAQTIVKEFHKTASYTNAA